MSKRVAVYSREGGSRQYDLANPRTLDPGNTVFCLRYTQRGRRKWDTLNVANLPHPGSNRRGNNRSLS